MIKGVWESVGFKPHIHTKGWELIRGTSGWCGLLKWEGELVGGAWFAWEMGWKLSL